MGFIEKEAREIGWPTFEDGEPVRIGDATEDARKVCRISFTKRGFYFNSSHRAGLKRYRHGEAVKRPQADSLDSVAADISEMARVYRMHRDLFDAQAAAAEVVGSKTLAAALDRVVSCLERLASE